MDEINPEFPQTDVVLVVGANDVINPAARNDRAARSTGCRSSTSTGAQSSSSSAPCRPGFAGIDNPLFYEPKTVMLFGDAKAAMEKLIAAVKQV